LFSESATAAVLSGVFGSESTFEDGANDADGAQRPSNTVRTPCTEEEQADWERECQEDYSPTDYQCSPTCERVLAYLPNDPDPIIIWFRECNCTKKSVPIGVVQTQDGL
jgi:hypothetical protein